MNALEREKLATVSSLLGKNGWKVSTVPALTFPDPARIVGFEAFHSDHGRIFGESLRDLVERVERKLKARGAA